MKTKCFSCGEPTGTVVQRISAPFHKKYICTSMKCWKEWWNLSTGSTRTVS